MEAVLESTASRGIVAASANALRRTESSQYADKQLKFPSRHNKENKKVVADLESATTKSVAPGRFKSCQTEAGRA